MRVMEQLLWGPHVILSILAVGIWLTLRSGFMQLRRIPVNACAALRGNSGEGGISALQALSASLAGSLGTGNIVGVAAAITVGGPGAVVWMWISAFFGMMTVYAEGFLAAKYSESNAPGATGYIQKALGRPAAVIYAAGCVLSALGMGSMAQTGAISAALSTAGVPNWISGVITAALLILCVRGGLSSAVRVTERLVPLMSGIFLAACVAVLVLRAEYIPGAIMTMLSSAFSTKAAVGGVGGMWLAMRTGISRGVFTNEAGLGSGAFALCRARGKTPELVGTLGAIQVFIDTILLCTITGLCMLVSPGTGEGAEYTLSSFSATLGNLGSAAVSVSMALFAFATVIAWSCYGMDALLFAVNCESRMCRRVYVLFAAAACFMGCVLPFAGVLAFCDAFNGIMAVPNLMAVLRLSNSIFEKNGQKKKNFLQI